MTVGHFDRSTPRDEITHCAKEKMVKNKLSKSLLLSV